MEATAGGTVSDVAPETMMNVELGKGHDDFLVSVALVMEALASSVGIERRGVGSEAEGVG